MDYKTFIDNKRIKTKLFGKTVSDSDIHPMLFPFQRDVTRWAIGKGRAALFLDTGLGKTFCQLEWARLMGEMTLIVAPLSVARQTVREGKKIGIDVSYVRKQDDIDYEHAIYITNYEMIDNFDFSQFGAVVLDESSILKALAGVTRRKLTEACLDVKYRLACTATPAPNDMSEIGNHAEFLGICSMAEMLAMFFIHANRQEEIEVGDGTGRTIRKKHSNKEGTEWRLKNHAHDAFYEWMASWAMSLRKPSDLGYDDNGYILPSLNINPIFVDVDYKPEDQLFFTGLKGIQDRHNVRRATLDIRLDEIAKTIDSSDEQWIVWCGLQAEADAVQKQIAGAVQVKGNDEPDTKAKAFEDFQDQLYKVLITKGKIGGFGMNFQNAHNMIFFGLGDSWEMYYQCIRRQWRFGQTEPVNVYIILSEVEREIYTNVMQKEMMARTMSAELIAHVQKFEEGELKMSNQDGRQFDYKNDTVTGDTWMAMLGDSCQRMAEISDNSIDLSVYSPPFADLYTYSASELDLGNSRNWDEFFEHYAFIISEVLRVTRPGRLTCVHTSDIPAMAQKDGYIGMRDFPGAVIKAYEDGGWIFVGRAFVQKNPQAQAIRTKSKALLFVQLRKDSSDSRPAIVDQVLLFKKPGDNATPVNPVANGEMDNETWIEWANGIWLNISESDTLQYSTARDTDDEKHICPLQLGTIERCIKLYSNPGETVFTPFMGIGSEAYQAVKFGRNAIGIELKESYFKIAVKNLKECESVYHTDDLFSYADRQMSAARN